MDTPLSSEVVEAITEVVNKLAPHYTFSCYTTEDLKHEAWIIAIKAYKEKYDGVRPLKNFLYCHLRNRLINFKRDNFRRTESPCPLCNRKADGETGHPSHGFCAKHNEWMRQNNTKVKLKNFWTIKEESIGVFSALNAEGDVDYQDLLAYIDVRLPVSSREAYLKLKDGVKLSRPIKIKLIGELQCLLKKSGV